MYRVGIVGLNDIACAASPQDFGPQWGLRHAASHAAAYAERQDVEVVAVCDLRGDLIDRFRGLWSGRWPSLEGYTDFDEMLARAGLDLLSVCTGDHLHAPFVLKAARAGVRGILCEKPIATTLKDADAMIEAAKISGTVLVVDHTRRWLPEYAAAKSLVAAGEIGRVRSVEASWFGPRSMLFRIGTHVVDAMLYIAGGEPEWVLATLPDRFAGYGPRYAGDGGRDPDTDPDVSAIFQLAPDIRGVLHMVRSQASIGEIRVVGDRGMISIRQDGSGYIPEHAEFVRLDEAGLAFRRPLPRSYFASGAIGAAVNELIGLVEGTIETPTSPPEDARKTLSLLLGILQSSHSGKKVRFPVEDA